MGFNLKSIFKKVEDAAVDVLEEVTDPRNLRKVVDAAEDVLISDKSTPKRTKKQSKPRVLNYGEPPERKYLPALIVYPDGTEKETSVPIDGFGEPIMPDLPEGAEIHFQSFVSMPDSPFKFTDRSDNLLPKRLEKCQPIYDAVGRIGYLQKGKPTGWERKYGTGILVSPKHILTNLHVAANLAQEDHPENLGIEFGAELNTPYSDFKPLKDITFVNIKGYDAAILTLRDPVTNRKPAKIAIVDPETLRAQDVVVIGYPSEFCDSRPKLTLGAKRYTEGKIFTHSTDQDADITVPVASVYTGDDYGIIHAICHNASTLPGSSGSAVVNSETGELVALHFYSDVCYDAREEINWDDPGEAANFAIPGAAIALQIENIIRSQ